MRRRTIRLAPLLVLVSLAIPRPCAAQEQIKPYFMLIFDNSGSMDGAPMQQAKTAVSNIVNSTGDAVFGLERFLTCTTPASLNCPNCPGGWPTWCDGEILVGIYEDNQDAILVWTDGVCDFDTGQYEITTRASTPLAASLDEAHGYFENGITNGWGTWSSPIELDQDAVPPVDHCRPYSVILLTDGQETCSGDPEAEATELRTTTVDGEVYDVRTYAIGFRLAAPNDEIEDIANAGGTDNPDPLYLGFYPQDDVDLQVALSQIIQDSLLVEVCNGVDDDCDLLIDEGVTNACGGCGPLVEACDGDDDDCDGEIDEGFPLYCDRPNDHFAQDLCADPGETVCDGVDDNCNGAIDEDDICAGCAPSGEICDGIDNDCDGIADDGLTRPCGTDVGECSRGVETCVAGAWGACSGQGPVDEECNGLDDDCNGVADGMLETCGTDEGECQAGARRCEDGELGDCVGEVGPREEICDGLDNDCDGEADEDDPGGGAACGTDEGECTSGIYACVGGELVCDDVGPSAEACDGLDNDCDGEADENNPGGGGPCGLEDEGECSDGVLQCADGQVECIGGQGPSVEICDGRDNDCDGDTDEGNPGGGAGCGTEEGECEAGTLDCQAGELICVGEVPPSDEVCDGLDNDCDGGVDEGLPVGDPCGTDVGECEPGLWVCEGGDLVCQGESGPTEEECNGLDDDCDSEIDEGLGLGDECGTEIGLCVPGLSQCLEGGVVCAGGTPPQAEVCDCEDNDCDGSTDENPDEICPAGSRCIDCDCASPCSAEQEFPCPPGRECIDGWCIGNLCSGVTCPEGERCVRGDCVSRCEGIVCDAGLRCSESLCLVDDCFNFPDDCGEGEACVDGDCAPHPCEGVACGAAEYCRAGDCVGSCVGVECAGGQRCVDGSCETDRCAGVECNERRFC
ncbi:MAG: hypothetical protein HYY06_12975, partial [Deltaproteobacteria bacterium]|nr:hypothetical protein [Deltaproteobacteria bacterium]